MAAPVATGPTVLLGASSQIGLFTIPRLLATGHSVVAISRHGPPRGYADFADVRWSDLEGAENDAASASHMISAGPLQLAEVAMAVFPAVRRLVAFSTTSVLTKADSPDRHERREIVAIRAAESGLASRCRRLNVELCLLRPTLVYGAGLDRNVSLLARWTGYFPLVPLAANATGLRQPVHADDLAQAAVAALNHGGALPGEFVLAGGSTLGFRCMVDRIIAATGARSRVLPVPSGLLAGIAGLARVFGIRAVGRAMVRRQSEDLVFDDGPARELLHYTPRPFRPGPDDFRLPEARQLFANAAASRADDDRNGVKI